MVVDAGGVRGSPRQGRLGMSASMPKASSKALAKEARRVRPAAKRQRVRRAFAAALCDVLSDTDLTDELLLAIAKLYDRDGLCDEGICFAGDAIRLTAGAVLPPPDALALTDRFVNRAHPRALAILHDAEDRLDRIEAEANQEALRNAVPLGNA
ncbi:hypothetical protein KPL78_06540 [Roseomonas sp. HJA6]|uniref:Uncharacterized protein n=1 Tax=Roseomonas alba TaxID=2846776 RepID=A0ABS7A5A7_9PROT|nr:hypothetical protein [Neoroseomonas alba]MBW6397496.1 hypothetical protein [Neoroseomonas alba]